MGRHQKQTVDYFPHMTDASDGKTLFILESEFGNDGFAFWFKLLELLGKTEGHVYDTRNPSHWRFLTAKTHIQEDTARKILDRLVELNAIDGELYQKEGLIWCQNFVDGVRDAYRNRKVSVPERPSINGNKPSMAGISDVRKPQSKEEETRENNTREEKDTTESEFNEYIEELRLEYPDLDFENQFKKFKLYWSEGPKKLKRPKTALKNWMDKAREFKKEKDGQSTKRPRALPDTYTKPEDIQTGRST